MNFVDEIEKCMEIEDIETMKSELNRYQEYFNSEKYLSKLTPRLRELINKANNYKALYDIKLERTQFTVESGVACSLCSNFIGASELCIEKDGEKFYISVHFIDEVPETLSFYVSKERSVWSLYFDEHLLPEEKLLSEDEKQDLNEYIFLSIDSDDKSWIESEYAVLFLAAIYNLKEGLMKHELEDKKMDAQTLCFRFFYSTLWLSAFLEKDMHMDIYDTISMY